MTTQIACCLWFSGQVQMYTPHRVSLHIAAGFPGVLFHRGFTHFPFCKDFELQRSAPSRHVTTLKVETTPSKILLTIFDLVFVARLVQDISQLPVPSHLRWPVKNIFGSDHGTSIHFGKKRFLMILNDSCGVVLRNSSSLCTASPPVSKCWDLPYDVRRNNILWGGPTHWLLFGHGRTERQFVRTTYALSGLDLKYLRSCLFGIVHAHVPIYVIVPISTSVLPG